MTGEGLRTLVIQSARSQTTPEWIARCLASVQDWCEVQGHDWRFIGDDIFDLVPHWYLEKSGKGPVATDYARLLLLRQALDTEGYDQAIWLDADVFVIDPAMDLACAKSCAFGQEIWVQGDPGNLKGRVNVHNAVCLFRRGCVVLPFLIDTVASIIRRADPAHIAPQMVGPKLLSALHSLYDFDLLPQVGAISPALAAALMAGEGEALDVWRKRTRTSMQAANLCASLISNEDAGKVIAGLSLLA